MNTKTQLKHAHAKMLTPKPTYKALGHLNAIVKLFKDKVTAKEIAGLYPEYFPTTKPNKIYEVKDKLVQLGLAEKSPAAVKMVETKKRMLLESNVIKSTLLAGLFTPISTSVSTPVSTPVVTSTPKSMGVKNSTIKIKFHGVMLEIEKSSHIIITREQITVQ